MNNPCAHVRCEITASVLDKGVDASLITSDPCRRARGGLLARLRSVKAVVFADFVPAVI